MRVQDYPFAVELANTMNWNMAAEDFEFMASLEPQGCFVAFQDTERIGIATCISYGKLGWFGNLIVKSEYRKRGVGGLLVRHAVEYLQSRGVQTVGLYAYPNLVAFYSSLGFQADEDFTVLQAQNLSCKAPEALPKVTKQQMGAIEAFDRQCFGGDRKQLLESIILDDANPSYYVSESGEVVGYVAATVYERMAWVGPLICQNYDASISLVKGVLSKLGGKTVYAVLPKKPSPLLNELLAVGFREEFFVSRMFLGEATAKNCVYLAESLERG